MMTFFSWSQSVLSLFCLADSLVDICIFMPTDLLADWFQQPYVHVEMESSNLIFLPFFKFLTRKMPFHLSVGKKLLCVTTL